MPKEFTKEDKKLMTDATKELISNPSDMLNIFKRYKKKIIETGEKI